MHSPPPDPKPRRGGARAGAGRKTQTGDGPMKPRTVSLDDVTVATLTAYGDGELSEGIRRAARVKSVVAKTKGNIE
jgi:hypothetical protein